jgi:hypothetical protein
LANKTFGGIVGESMRKGLIALVLLGGNAFAQSHNFVVELGHVGGDEQAAQPYIDQFMRYAEQAMHWPASSARGRFVTKQPEAVAYIDQEKPVFGILDPEVFLDLHKKYELTALASVQIKDHQINHLSVVVKNPAYKSLADLKGKKIVSNHLGNAKYLSRVAFGSAGLDFAKDFTLEPTASPLKGLKAVRDGAADATIVDDGQLAKLKEFDPGLRAIDKSPQLPPTAVVSFGNQSDAGNFTKMLMKMCTDAKGADVCKNLFIEKFTPPDRAAYDAAIRKYEK